MENHPIPQDVTGFKFRLIGSITVKQFLYIIGTGALCGVFFIMPISFLIKWPMIILIAAAGAALAFLPIEGRPMDVMLLNFLKALPAENRYIFKKQGAKALIHEFFTPQNQTPQQKQQPEQQQQKSKKELLMSHLSGTKTSYKPDEEEQEQLKNIKGYLSDPNTPVTGMQRVDESPQQQSGPSTVVRPPQNTSSNQPVKADGNDEDESSQTQSVGTPQPQYGQANNTQTQNKPQATAQTPQQNPQNNQQEQQDQDEANVQNQQKQPQQVQQPQPAPQQTAEPNANPQPPKQNMQTQGPKPNVHPQPEPNQNQQAPQAPSAPAKTVDPENRIESGFPQIPDTPNVVLGIVKDPRGKVLPNIIVEVVDENKNPVRAFKTNALGQFASATPLSEGKYQIILEDPKGNHEFTPIDIELKNEIFQPIEIISTDQREKLRQDLFGGSNQNQQQ